MKITQIRRTGPELYLVTYTTRCPWSWLGLKREVERWVIVEISTESSIEHPMYEVKYTLYFRDSDELAHDCWHQIEWMIRNEIDFFDNDESPDPDWPRPDKNPAAALGNSYIEDPYPYVSLTGYVPNIPTVPPIPSVKNNLTYCDKCGKNHWAGPCNQSDTSETKLNRI